MIELMFLMEFMLVINKTIRSEECYIYRYWYFLDKGF